MLSLCWELNSMYNKLYTERQRKVRAFYNESLYEKNKMKVCRLNQFVENILVKEYHNVTVKPYNEER